MEVTTSVPIKYHKHFVARRGAVLRDLADEYGGVTVSFPRQGQDSEEVKIKGAKDCVAAAESRIKEIVDDLVCLSITFSCANAYVSLLQENQVTIECVIPEKYHRTVIGTKGSNVQTITSEHDVNIKFPDRQNSAEGRSIVKSFTNTFCLILGDLMDASRCFYQVQL